jgi:hypothetical protein
VWGHFRRPKTSSRKLARRSIFSGGMEMVRRKVSTTMSVYVTRWDGSWRFSSLSTTRREWEKAQRVAGNGQAVGVQASRSWSNGAMGLGTAGCHHE